MTFLIYVLIGLLGITLLLAIILGIAFIRLGRELRRLGDDTESMAARLQRVARATQVALPLIALVKNGGKVLLDQYRSKTERKK